TNMTRQRAGQIIKVLATLANMDVSKISPHTLRHSFATHLLSKGVNLKNLQDLLGHKNISTTEIYTHLTYENLEKLLQEKHPLNRKS
ncbi:MAG: tyrosine-type recombinase/integrase, partial [bacterium]